ncbi:26S proteasome non-ATPase regulatory subunit 4 [Glycine soja]|nr:26S proteasome non-ATPase regulatory subunit 4 [Glycine soja]
MVLEATMICIDNSEWMRNGDYSPSRFQAQADAVNLICGAKTQSNPENTVGVLTMAGKGVRVLVTPTSDLGKILACMHGLDIGGEMNLAAGIQVAQLALKHRQNKKQQQRIIVFAGSPVKHEKKMLEMIGRKLKKNSVALDIVNFGEEDEGKTEKLEALLAAVNNNDTSHIVHVPSGPNALSDVLISTPIFTGDDENALLQQALAMSMDDSAISHDVKDTDMSEASASDPDLALALQLSITDSAKDQSSQSDMSKLLADQSFVSSILASLPGVDPNDPSVKDLLASMQNQSEPQQKNDDKPSNEEEKK